MSGRRFTSGGFVTRNAAARCRKLIGGLTLPELFDLDLFLAVAAEQRGKPIRAVATQPTPGESTGLLLNTGRVDEIFHPEDAAPLHAQHIVLHELGHLLLAHDTGRAHDVAPGSVFTDESEAELFATMLGLRATAPATSRRATLAIQAALRALDPLWRLLVDAAPSARSKTDEAAAVTGSSGDRRCLIGSTGGCWRSTTRS